MKRIVIACDGTWKRIDAPDPTNVARLAQAVLPVAPGRVPQIVCHLDGVGTGQGTGRVSRALDRALGGAFGQGLMASVAAAYRFLVFTWAPGDEIQLFGFSRGAYTARSLAGLIRNVGILPRRAAAHIQAAIALYQARRPEGHPNGPEALAFRERLGAAETDIAYLGVWDTVWALGVPGHLRLAGLVNRGLTFHDLTLSGRVRAARHAVAVDERRRHFPPALWDNLDALNALRGAGRPYRQEWFPGDHGSVGGGGPVTALSHGALSWIADGAMGAGLALCARSLAEWQAGADPLGPLTAQRGRPGLIDRFLAIGARDRTGPDDPAMLAAATRLRWQSDSGYRPRTLAALAEALGRDAATRSESLAAEPLPALRALLPPARRTA